jgi:succinyl-CoA synthetase beta subunit
MVDLPQISEVEVNPLIVGPAGKGVWAVDVRLVLKELPDMA